MRKLGLYVVCVACLSIGTVAWTASPVARAFHLPQGTNAAKVENLKSKGKVCFRMKQYDQAVAFFRQALQLSPTDGESYSYLAQIMDEQKNPTAAAQYRALARQYGASDGGTNLSAPMTGSRADTTPPRIVVTSPSNSRGMGLVASSLTVAGQVTDDSGVAEVLVAGKPVSLDGSGNFSTNVSPKAGDTYLDIVAADVHGNQASERVTFRKESDSAPTPTPAPAPSAAPSFEGTTFHALLIAVQDYQDPKVTKLDQPIADAERLKTALVKNYTFEEKNVILLKNPDRKAIIGALDGLAKRLDANTELLIFYAGHGHYDEDLKQGFWLPVNAAPDDRVEWIPNGTIRDYVNGIKSRHTFLISDACFSGSIFKTRDAFAKAPSGLRELHKYPSRKAMTSGAMKTVPDKSVFAEYLVRRLAENREEFLTSEQLFSSFRQAVINNSPNNQLPQFGEIHGTGDEGGDFIFVRRK